MAVAPGEMLSTESTVDMLSPTAMVIRYLQSKGMQPTADNIRRAISANALDPGQAGPFMISDSAPGGTQLRNTQVEDNAPARAISRAIQPARWDLTEPDARWDMPGQPPGLQDSRPVLPRVGNMPGPGPNTPMPPPPEGAPVAPRVPPELPPPAPAAAVTPPVDPLGNAVSQALEPPRLGGPSPQLALPPPEAPVRPAIAGPPPVPQIEAAPRPLALAPPEVPRAPARPLALPPPDPKLGGIPPAPGKQVQGAPIEQTPLSRGVGRTITGAVTGAARGATRGPGGAIVGGLAGAAQPLVEALGPSAKEIVPYIMRNLHLQ